VALITNAWRTRNWFMKEQSAKIHGAGLAIPGTGKLPVLSRSTLVNCRKLSAINWPLKRVHLDNWVENRRKLHC
jgi:hypothetical protein